MTVSELQIAALDGEPLNATFYQPEGEPLAAVIVNPATGTPRGFYRAFCEHLASLGAAAVTYDYRGTAQPAAVLKRSRARMRDWGERDFPGVIDWLQARYPRLPVQVVGHSVGGHVLLLAPNNAKVVRAVLVATQSGYWKLYRGFERWRVYAFMKIIMPFLTRMFGYFPGSRVAFGVDLAPGVLYEWSRWCTSPQYFFADTTLRSLENAKHYTAPTRMIGLADDPWGTPQALDAFQIGFSNAPVERVEIQPASVGLPEIGHMGFFRSRNSACWRYATDTLLMRSLIHE